MTTAKSSDRSESLGFFGVMVVILSFASVALVCISFFDHFVHQDEIRSSNSVRLMPLAPTELVIPYDGKNGRPMEFIWDVKSGRTALRIDARYEYRGPDELALLREEVVRLIRISVNNPTPLGKSGLYFQFQGNYPIYDPSTQVGSGHKRKTLCFAQDAVIADGIITAKGQRESSVYNPYWGLPIDDDKPTDVPDH